MDDHRLSTGAIMLPFALPDITEAEIDEVVRVLRSSWITSGPKVQEFEAAFSAFLGGVETVSVNSCTAGLHLALEAAGIGEGDEVIVPVYTFTATAGVVSYVRAKPIFVDVDPHTLCIDVEQTRRALTTRTKAVIPVHFAGLACDMDAVISLAREFGLYVIEDAAHAFPTVYHKQTIGALETTATVFSFYATKPLTTGEGGMVTTQSASLAKRMRVMRLHGIDRDVFNRYRSPGAQWYYQIVAPGFKYNMTDVAAALGLIQLSRAWDMWRRRASIADAYNEALRSLPIMLPAPSPPGDVHSWHLYPIRLTDDSSLGRDELKERLLAAGLSTSVHYVPLHFHPFWRDTYDLRAKDFPVATDAFSRILSLPIYSRMQDADVARVIGALTDALAKA
jgi:dTDP-4-amino-4,6-dideoxygalactose transaminase